MAVVNGYATLAHLRTHLGDSGTLLTAELLERALEAASRAIDRHTGRKFWLDAEVETRTYRPDDPYLAWVDDIGSTTGVVVRTDTTGDGTWATTWDAGDYQLEPLNADVFASTPYAWWRIAAIDDKTFPVREGGNQRRPTLQVTARFGWSEIPDEIEQACLLKAAALFKRKDSPNGVQGMGDFGVVRIGRNDPDVLGLLAPYRKLTVAAV